MLARIGIQEPVMMTGGGRPKCRSCQCPGKKLGAKIEVSDYMQVNGAIGAAVLASSL